MNEATSSNRADFVPSHPDKNVRNFSNQVSLDFYAVDGSDLSLLCQHGTGVQVYDELTVDRRDLNKTTDAHAASMLYIAAEHNNTSAAEMLLSMNAEVNIPSTIAGASALHVAAQEGLTRMALLLLQRRADVNAAAIGTGSTPLLLAVHHNRRKMANLLIDNNANVNQISSNHSTPLLIAAQIGSHELVRILRNRGAIENKEKGQDGAGILYYSARSGHTDMVSHLLHFGYAEDDKEEAASALYIAAKEGKEEVVHLLLQRGLYYTSQQLVGLQKLNMQERYLETAIDIAAYNGHLNIVRMMLDFGASIGFTEGLAFPLYNAARNGKDDMVSFLLDRRADVNMVTKKQGVSALYIAALHGHKGVVAQLLANGANVSLCTLIDGEPPLHAAVKAGHIDVLLALLEFQADVDQVKEYNQTALLTSVLSFQAEVVTVLLEHGANVFHKCTVPYRPHGTSPLSAASWPRKAFDEGTKRDQEKILEKVEGAAAMIRYLRADTSAHAHHHGKVLMEALFTPVSRYESFDFQSLIFAGAFQNPFTQWVYVMPLEIKKSLFDWARKVDGDMRAAFRLVYIDALYSNVAYGNSLLDLWKSVLSFDRFPGLCQLFLSFFVPKKVPARWIIREMAAYGVGAFVSEPGCYTGEHKDAFARSLVVRNRRILLEKIRAENEDLKQSTERIRAKKKQKKLRDAEGT